MDLIRPRIKESIVITTFHFVSRMEPPSCETLMGMGIRELRPLIKQNGLTRHAKICSNNASISRRGALQSLCQHYGYDFKPTSTGRSNSKPNEPTTGSHIVYTPFPDHGIVVIDPPYITDNATFLALLHENITIDDTLIIPQPLNSSLLLQISREFPNPILFHHSHNIPPSPLPGLTVHFDGQTSFTPYPVPAMPRPSPGNWAIQSLTIENMFNHQNLHVDFPSGIPCIHEPTGRTNIIRALHLIFDVGTIEITRCLTQGCVKGSLTCRFLINQEELILTRKYRISKDSRADCHSTVLRITGNGPVNQSYATNTSPHMQFLSQHINTQWLTTNYITSTSLQTFPIAMLGYTSAAPKGLHPEIPGQQTLTYANTLLSQLKIPFTCKILVQKRTATLLFANTQTGGLYTRESLSRRESLAITLCLTASAAHHNPTHLTLLVIDTPITISLLPFLADFPTILPLTTWDIEPSTT